MNEKIIAETKKELEKAVQKFEAAKVEAIASLKNMDTHTAVDFGAALACHIDDVTRYAAEVEKQKEFLRMVEYYSKNN